LRIPVNIEMVENRPPGAVPSRGGDRLKRLPSPRQRRRLSRARPATAAVLPGGRPVPPMPTLLSADRPDRPVTGPAACRSEIMRPPNGRVQQTVGPGAAFPISRWPPSRLGVSEIFDEKMARRLPPLHAIESGKDGPAGRTLIAFGGAAAAAIPPRIGRTPPASTRALGRVQRRPSAPSAGPDSGNARRSLRDLAARIAAARFFFDAAAAITPLLGTIAPSRSIVARASPKAPP